MTTPTPPPGYEILTDYTKPFVAGSLFLSVLGRWGAVVTNPIYIKGVFYAVPIAQTESEVKPCAAPPSQQCQQNTPNVTAIQQPQSKTTEPVGPVAASNSPANVPSVSAGNILGGPNYLYCSRCERETLHQGVNCVSCFRAADADKPHPSPGEELEEVRQIVKDTYSALHVDPEQVSERMARDIIRHARKGLDVALDTLTRITNRNTGAPGEQLSEQREELKPCPFCGAAAEVKEKRYANTGNVFGYRITCQCGIELIREVSHWVGSRDEAIESAKYLLIKQWNTRA